MFYQPFLQQVRAAHKERIEAACIRAQRAAAPSGMPYLLQDAGIWLAAQGFEDEPCPGERWFGMDFDAYRALACPDAIESGRKALRDGRNPILVRFTETVDGFVGDAA